MNRPLRINTESPVQGLKYLELLGTLLTDLHNAGADRDRAGNRRLFYDQYALLFLLYYYNPTITSLRGLQRMSDLAKVQHLGIHRTALGSLSEAQQVFDAALLEKVIAELVSCLPIRTPKPEQAALLSLTAIDGSLLPALPRMAWALWQDDQHRAASACGVFGVPPPHCGPGDRGHRLGAQGIA